MNSKRSKTIDYEASIAELETIVQQMEGGKLSLEGALAQFEAGIKLAHACQSALTQAEQKVQILLEKNGQIISQDFLDLNSDD